MLTRRDTFAALSVGFGLLIAGCSGTTLQQVVTQILTLLKEKCPEIIVSAEQLVQNLTGIPVTTIVPDVVATSICAQFKAAEAASTPPSTVGSAGGNKQVCHTVIVPYSNKPVQACR